MKQQLLISSIFICLVNFSFAQEKTTKLIEKSSVIAKPIFVQPIPIAIAKAQKPIELKTEFPLEKKINTAKIIGVEPKK